MWIYERVEPRTKKVITVYADNHMSIDSLYIRDYTYDIFDVICGKKTISKNKWMPHSTGGVFTYYLEIPKKSLSTGASLQVCVYNKTDYIATFDGWFSQAIDNQDNFYDTRPAIIYPKAVKKVFGLDGYAGFFEPSYVYKPYVPLQVTTSMWNEPLRRNNITYTYQSKYPIKFISDGGFGMMSQQEKTDIVKPDEIKKPNIPTTVSNMKQTISNAMSRAFKTFLK